MPKVLFVVPHLSNSLRLLADYLRHLDDRFEVTLFVEEPNCRFEHEFPQEARKIIQTPSNRFVAKPRELWNIFRAARGQDLLVGWAELTPTYLTVLAGMLRRKPVVGWVHAHLSQVFALKKRPPKLHRPVMKLLYPRLVACVGCSVGVGKDLRENFGLSNAMGIPNGIDLDRVRGLGRQPVPAQLESVFDEPVVINVAALHVQKNQQLLLRSHAELIRQGIPHHLLFVGAGPLESELKQQVKDLGIDQTTFFAGYIDNPYPLIARSRLLVLCSHWEGLPLVLPEALSLDVPVVSTDCPSGPREVLDGGRYGKLVPLDDLPALTEALRALLVDDQAHKRAQSLASAGAERMSIIPRAQQMADLFWDVLRANGYEAPDSRGAAKPDRYALTRP